MNALAAIARTSKRRAGHSGRSSAPHAMPAVVNVLPYRTQVPVFENREAMDYIAHLTARCHPVTEAERATIMAYAQAWNSSADIRAEFGQFSLFASFMRGRRTAGGIR